MPTIDLSCDNCLKPFSRRESTTKTDKGRGRRHTFCSNACKGEFRSKQARISTTCSYCQKPMTVTRSEAAKSKSGRHFCCPSCSSSYNAKDPTIARKRANLKTLICHRCGGEFESSRHLKKCPVCIADEMPLGDRTLGDFSSRAERHRKVRNHAHHITASRPQVCAVTGYSKHVHTAHIRPIPDFADHTPLKVVNDPRNLILLSPNAHTELDCGELEVDELPDAVAFREFEGEAIEAGYLVSA